MKDIKSNIGVVQLLEPKNYVAADTKSALLDLKGFAAAVIVVELGTFAGTVNASNNMLPVIQESDSTADASFTPVAADDILGAFSVVDSTDKDQTCQCVGYRGTKRYVRVLLDYTGAGISASVVGVTAIVGVAGKAPVVAPVPVAAT